jgi:CMP-N-acetylneuraminic acid synthetase
LEEKENYKPDIIILLQPTSPLRTSKHIDEALEKLINSDADSIVSVVEVPHQFNPYSVMKLEDGYLKHFLPYDERKNIRQLKPKFYARNGAAIYAFRYECLIEKNSIYGEKILPYFMGKEESIDIDDWFDLKVAEVMISAKKS